MIVCSELKNIGAVTCIVLHKLAQLLLFFTVFQLPDFIQVSFRESLVSRAKQQGCFIFDKVFLLEKDFMKKR